MEIFFGLKNIAVVITILALYDFVSLSRNVISVLAFRSTLLRWIVYVVAVIFFMTEVPVRTSQEFIYFQF